MTPFLQHVANDLKTRFSNDLSHVAVVFPGKRAGLFLNEYLAAGSDTPVWTPRYITISELFRSLSHLRPADPIETVCRIYALYVAATEREETLDFFYGWGERLLADFDDVDKNMADASRLFCNLRDIKEIETHEYLTPEQEHVLQSFFQDFSVEGGTQLRHNFLRLWNNLYGIYTALRQQLRDEGLAYEGAMYRSVIEELEAGRVAFDNETTHYVFVGFNVLNRVEQRLMSLLQGEGRALFYWDYDIHYTEGNNAAFEAGIFLRDNLKRFPSALPRECFDNLRREKDIEFASAASESIQASSATDWLHEHITPDEKRTAVVLCNEDLLQPLLYAIPPEVKEVNITKGFPLHHTAVYARIESTSIDNCTAREWLDKVMERVKAAAEQAETERLPEPERTLHGESCFLAYTLLSRFVRIMDRGWLDVTPVTLLRLVRQVMRGTGIPISGEPAVGLQVMGLLETRCLDFDNVLMLSVGEGFLPTRTADTSFIPYALRREFGLTTPRHRTAVFAYYFYRLLQRADHVRMVYSCATDGMVKGERSRFLTQLLVEGPHPVRHFTLSAQQSPDRRPRPVIPKPADLAERLATLSPSSINAYLWCPLSFYFRRVVRLHEPDPDPDVIEASTFGSIFHKAAEIFYKRLRSRRAGMITAEMLAPYLDKDGEVELRALVRQAFAEERVKENIVVAEVITTYLRQLLRHDHDHTPFTIIDTEREVSLPLTVDGPEGRPLTLTLKGTIDRIDRMVIEGCERMRIVDYKTGGTSEAAADMEALFQPAKNHPHYVLQTFLYALTQVKGADRPLAPALFFVHQAAGKDYSPYLKLAGEDVLDFAPLADTFRKGLQRLIAEILDPKQPFTATPIRDHCRSCPFVTLCE